MMDIALAPSERKQLLQFASLALSGRECCRAQALLWLDDGEAVDNIADRLQVSRQTLYNWVRRFQARTDVPIEDRLREQRIHLTDIERFAAGEVSRDVVEALGYRQVAQRVAATRALQPRPFSRLAFTPSAPCAINSDRQRSANFAWFMTW